MARRKLRGALGARSPQAGALVAVATVPDTFQRTLMPRSALDQGLVTGLSMGIQYGLTVTVQDAIEATAALVTGHADGDEENWRAATLVLDAAAVVVGSAIRRGLRQRDKESNLRGIARVGGHWLSVGGFAGGLVGALQEVESWLGNDVPQWMPVAVPAASGLAMASEYARRRRESKAGELSVLTDEQWHLSAGKSLGYGVAVGAGLAGLTAAEEALAHLAASTMARYLPGGRRLWRPVAHVLSLATLAGLVRLAMHYADNHVEEGERRIEAAFDTAPTSPDVSGGPGSVVEFATLSKQGRRNVVTTLTAAHIEAVMEEPAVADPIRVFVGLQSGADEEARVALAMAELERTGAFERSLLMVISPTGTGYVNYVAVESVELMSRGDVASVTMQYSERPSVMSIGRVWEGRRQNRLLIEAIHARLAEMPVQDRPRVVLFGESLGAHTSQDAFLHEGTRGLVDLGVESAVWIGTPYGSAWKDQVLDGGYEDDDAADVDARLVGVFNDFGQVEALDPEARRALRYVMISHDDDAVTKFGPDLFLRQPSWLGDPDARAATVPRSERWSTPTTFLLTLVDMKNSAHVVAGQFEAKGHDYRADLARFIREVYRFGDVDDRQLARIERALRRDEVERSERIKTLDAKS